MGAIGSFIGALIANKFKSSMNTLILINFNRSRSFRDGLTTAQSFLLFSGNLELFMTIFNIHFYQVQTKVDGDYLGGY